MKDKLKLAGICAVIATALLVAGVMAYRFFAPEPTLQKYKIFSASDLVRLEKSDPGALTDAQRQLLSAIPENQKKELLTKPSFSTAGSAPAPKPNSSN